MLKQLAKEYIDLENKTIKTSQEVKRYINLKN